MSLRRRFPMNCRCSRRTTPAHISRRLTWFNRFLFLLAALLAVTRLPAATFTWTGAGGDNSWHNPTNWNAGVVPGPADDAVISLAGASVEFSTGSAAIRSLTSSRPFTISGGALTVTNGFTLNSTTFTFTGGTLDAPNLATLNGGTAFLHGGDIVGQLRVINGNVVFAANATTTGLLLLNGPSNNLGGDVPVGMTLWVEGRSANSHAQLTVTNHAANHGTIRLETTQSTWNSSLATGGGVTFTNAASGTIQANAGTGGARNLNGDFENWGAVRAGSNANFTANGLVIQRGGVIQGDGEFRFSGARLDFRGGRLEGTVRAAGSLLAVADTVTEASTLRAVGTSCVLASNASPAVTVWVEGRSGDSNAQLNVTNNAVNRGTLLLQTTSSTWSSSLNVSGGVTLTNAAGGLIQANAGTGGARNLNGDLENWGTVRAGSNATLTANGRVTQRAGVIQGDGEFRFSGARLDFRGGRSEGTVRAAGSFLAIADTVTEASTLRAVGTSCVLASNASSSVTVWIEGRSGDSSAQLNVTNNAVNRGTILLQTTASTWSSSLNVAASVTLTNAAGGLIQATAGTGGARTIVGGIENHGTVLANTATTINGTARNWNTLRATSGALLAISGVLEQLGGVVHGQGEVRVSGSSTMAFRGGRLDGMVRAENSFVAVADTVTEASTLRVTGPSGILASNASPAVTLWIEGVNSPTSSQLTVTNATFNRGTIRLESSYSGAARTCVLTVSGGAVLVNATNGLIQINRGGAGGSRPLNGHIENHGTVQVAGNATATATGPFVQKDGLVRGEGEFLLQNGRFEFHGGRLEEFVRAENAYVAVADTVTEASTLRVTGPSGVLASNASPTVTLWIEGVNSPTSSQLTVTNATFNRGTIRLESSYSGIARTCALTVGSGGVLVNATNGLIQINRGGFGGPRPLNGHIENHGTVQVAANTAASASGPFIQKDGLVRGEGEFVLQNGRFEFHGGRLEEFVRAENAFVAVADTVTETSTLRVTGPSAILASNASPAVTLWVEGVVSPTSSQLTVTNLTFNRGTIRLESSYSGSARTCSLIVSVSAVLTNESPATIQVQRGGAGGLRIVNGSIENHGAFDVGNNAVATLQTGPFVNTVDGVITGVGTIDASSVSFTNHGTVAPGASPGQLSFTGHYVQSTDGILDIELGGLTVGTQYDRFAVNGTVTLDGTFQVRLADDFAPAPGNTFRVLTFTSRNGDFAAYSGLAAYTDVSLQADFLSNALDLTAYADDSQSPEPPTIAKQPKNLTIINGETATFTVTANGTRPFAYQWQFHGTNLPGANSATLLLPNAQLSQAGPYRVVVTNTAGSITSAVATLTVQAVGDLVITNIVHPADALAGQPVVLSWRSLNQGGQIANAPWMERVGISTNASGAPLITLGNFTVGTSLAAGQPLVHTQTVILPGGLDGEYYVVVTTDIHNQVVELVNEDNNTTVSPVPMLVRSPDLMPLSIVTPGAAVFGDTIPVSWVVTNAGAAPVLAAWNDRVYLGTNGISLVGALALATVPATNVPFAPGGTRTNSAQIALPFAANWTPGSRFLIVQADHGNAIAESNETNNLLAAAITLKLPPLPDLVAGEIAATTNALPGEMVSVSWAITNIGSASVTGAWTETVYLATNSAGPGLIELATFWFTNTLNAGEFVTRTQSVAIPVATPTGNLWFAVQADSRNDVFEGNEANNLGVAANATFLPVVLTLQLSAAQILEGSSQPLRATVTRNGPRTSPLTVTIDHSDPSELDAPGQVIIAAGQASAVFDCFALADGIVDGPQLVEITVSAPGFTNATATVTVLDADLPQLALSASTNLAFEGSTLLAQVTRDAGTNHAVVVNVTSSNPGRLLPPASVTIPVGQFSANVSLLAVDDLLVQLPASVTVSVSASNHLGAAAGFTVLDNDLPLVTLTLAATNFSESAGPQATTATLQRAPVTTAPIYIELASSNPNALLVPALVTIPASQGSVSFPVAAVDNDVLDGPKTVQVYFRVKTSPFGSVVSESAPVTVTVTDDEGPALTLTLAQSLVAEGANPATTVTVTRNTGTNGALLVNLASSDTGEATVPASVTIPDGVNSANFNIVTPTDGAADGSKSVVISASAASYAGASAVLTVTDVDLPDLVVQAITAPATAETEQFVSIGYTIRNQGLSPMASNTIVQRIYLSHDPVVGGDSLMGEYTFSGGLPAGSQFGQTFSVRMPQAAGDYWVIVETDTHNAVTEILEDNNRRISVSPISVTAAYDAVVSTTLESAPANTPVPLTGHAFKPGNVPAPFVLVNIHLNVRGAHRVISALTDAAGNFATTWQPLPGEAGFYEIGAAHTGATNAAAQDSFALYGMNAHPLSPTVRLLGQGVVTGAVEIVNAGDLPLQSVTAQVLSPPGNLNFAVSLPTNVIPGLAAVPLNYTISSTDGLAAQGVVVVRLTSAEGATRDVPFAVTVRPLTPQLEATPAALVRGMKRGAQSFVSIVVTNMGGAASGPITVSLPPLPWMSLASANPLPSLAPGEAATVSLQLMPPADLPLTTVTGNLLLSAGGSVAAVPFELRALSESKGDLRVTATDEFTYYAAGAPRVTNAVVVVRDAVSGAVVTNGVTGATGEWFAAQLPEGYYELEVTADKHDAYQGTHLLQAGVTNDISAFLSRQTVRYTWTVVPTEIEDRYRIVVTTEFEANVPAPVVTIEPAVIDLGDLEDEMQVDLKIENHGLIAAEDFELQFDPHEGVSFEPLVSRLGTLPAKSAFTVPLKIRRVNASAALAGRAFKSALIERVGACFATARGINHFKCGPFDKVQVTTISFPNAGPCVVDVVRTIYDWLPGGGGGVVLPPRPPQCLDCPVGPVRQYTGFYSSGGGGSRLLDLLLTAIYKATPALAVPNPCDPECLPKLIPVLFDCFGPDDDGPDPCPQNLGNCLPPLVLNPSEETVTDCMAAGLTCWFDYAKKNPLTSCIFDVLEACAPEEDEEAFALKRFAKRSFSGPYAGLLGTLQTRVDRVAAINDLYQQLLGDTVWRDSADQTLVKSFLGQFNAAIAAGSDAGTAISATELAGLQAHPLPAGVSLAHVNHAAERWNRSVAYWQAGIFTLDQVPGGNSTDFLAVDLMHSVTMQATNALHASQADGFATLEAGLRAALDDLRAELNAASGGVCAKVKLRLDQEAVVSRDAFKATLEIDNSEGSALENVYVTLGVLDSAGNDASARFGIHAPELSGITGGNGSGTLANQQTGRITWTLVPTADAAPTNATEYFVSGGLNYVVNGNAVTIPLSPAPITVHPSPRLAVKYFHQRDVFSDDPFTDVVEPAVPFSLGVLVQNRGHATARNFRLTSAQPQIVENEKGLLIDFKIIATEVAGQSLQPTLTAELGDIGPCTNAIARWLMTSTLQGLFIDYDATFEHVDGLGNPKLSLIDEGGIHEMIRVVQAAGAFDDGRPDFLVNDVPDLHDLPDTIYLSDGSTGRVEAVTSGNISGSLSPGNLQVTLTAPMPSGWAYLRVPDPGNGEYRLVAVTRADAVEITVETNAWVTDRTFRGLGKQPIRENILHLLDYDSPGSYTLSYALLPQPDTTPPASALAALPAESSSGIPLHWSGQDNSGGSGLAFFDLYVSENGGPFTRWLANATATSAIYQGNFGSGYAFYSVAVDQAGNREAVPATPDATTTVTRTNQPPVLAPIADRTIVEGQLLSVSLDVSDPDGDAVMLSLAPGAPVGVSVNSQTRLLSWVTGESHGPGTNLLTVLARDNGIPQLSAAQSFTVIVLETNSPPVLSPIANKTVSEGQLLTFSAVTTDSDLPPQKLTFSLGAGAPAGAAINPTNGVFTWTPTSFQGGVTNVITVIVTDDGEPPLSAARSFAVVVFDISPDFELRLATTEVLSGDSGSLALTLHSGADLTNLNAVIAISGDRLANLALQSLAPLVGGAELQPLGANHFDLRFRSQPAGVLQGNLTLAELAFDTVPNEHSAVIEITSAALTGRRTTGELLADGRAGKARVFVIGLEPILDPFPTNQQLGLVLYARPDESYSLERSAGLNPTNDWSLVTMIEPVALKTSLAPQPMASPTEFFRVVHATLLGRMAGGTLVLVEPMIKDGEFTLRFAGAPGQTCTIEYSDSLSPADWHKLTNVTVAADGAATFSEPPGATAQRFYRIVYPAY